jgi:DNA polymerase III alpha subunit
VQTAAKLEMKAQALTDYHSLTGAIEFYDIVYTSKYNHITTKMLRSAQIILSAIRQNQTLDKLSGKEKAPPSSDFIDQRQKKFKFENYKPAIEHTAEVADRCKLDLQLVEVQFLEMEREPGKSVIEILRPTFRTCG